MCNVQDEHFKQDWGGSGITWGGLAPHPAPNLLFPVLQLHLPFSFLLPQAPWICSFLCLKLSPSYPFPQLNLNQEFSQRWLVLWHILTASQNLSSQHHLICVCIFIWDVSISLFLTRQCHEEGFFFFFFWFLNVSQHPAQLWVYYSKFFSICAWKERRYE